ncbi:MAG: ribonuclease P protein component [Armatimonadetes bacterium]|nr:ribonuclease P protein component [Armatimonadota bacterium]
MLTHSIGRLSREEDFRRVYREGSRCTTALLVLHARPNGTERVRLGLVVSRRFGGAVARNRIRRRLREAVRAEQSRIRAGADMVVVPRRAAAAARYADLRGAVGIALDRAGMARAAEESGR